jgi:hypothetical protein
MEAIDGTSEDSLWAGTRTGEILRRNNRGWHHVQTLKTVEGKDIQVVKIDVRDENDVWVVGAYASPYTNALFHWDGNRFEQVTVPGLREFGTLSSMAAIGEDDAWFAGSPGRIWHWNGKEITQIQPDDEHLKDFELTGISAVSGNDIWAVGTITGMAYGAAVILHWDGSEWKIVKEWGGKEDGTEQPAIGNLWDVIAIAHDDVWAIGGNQAVHWNGHEWALSRMPNYEKYGNVGFGTLAASSSNDVWAVGTSWWGGPHPFALHWDGAQWSIVPAPMSLNLGTFDTAKSFSGKLLAAGITYQEEDHGPVYSMSAEFEFTPCP